MNAPKTKILIVDDEEDFTLMMGLTLQQTGQYLTRAENNAARAVEAARAFAPDLILLDVMMPEMDGGDVLAGLQGDPSTRQIPVIFLTALVGGEESPVGGLVSGGHCFVPKPVSLADLRKCMDHVLSQPLQPLPAPAGENTAGENTADENRAYENPADEPGAPENLEKHL